MNLWYYECLKIVQKKIFWYFIFCFILIDVTFVLGWKNIQDPSGYIQQYKEDIQEILANKPIEESYQWLQSEQQVYEEIQAYEQAIILQEEVKPLSKLANQYIAQFEDDLSFWNERTKVVEELCTYYKNILQYDTYIEGIYKKYKQIQQSPRWLTMTNNQKQDLTKQVQLFDKLVNTQIEVVSYDGIQTYVDISIGKYFALFYIILCVILLFQEDTAHMKELLYSTKNGHHKTLVAKAISLGILSIIGVSCFLIIDTYIYQVVFGVFPLFAQIQSIPSFYESPYAYSVLQWLCYSILYSTFSMTCIGYIFLSCFQVLKKRYFGVALFSVVIFLEALCYVMISKNSFLYPLSLYNIFQLCKNNLIGMIYPSLYMMQIGVPYLLCMSIGLVCITSISIFCFLKFENISYEHKRKTKVLYINISSMSVFIQESIRVLWIRKGIVLVGIVIVSCVSLFGYRIMHYQHLRNSTKEIAQVYDRYEGVVTTKSKQEIIKKIKEIKYQEDELKKAKQAYRQQSMTREDYISIQEMYDEQKVQNDVYKKIYKQIQEGASYIIYPNGFLAICNLQESNRNAITTLIIIVILIIWVSRIYVSQEEECLYQSTKYGRKKRMYWILCISLGIGIIIVSCVELFEYLHISSLYPMRNWDVPMQVLFQIVQYDDMYQWGIHSIQSYFMISMLIKLFGIISVIMIATTIFRYCKGQLQGILFCFLVFLLPMFLFYSNVTFASWFSIFDIMMGHKFLLDMYSIGKLLGLFVLDCIAYYAYHKSFQIKYNR